MRPGQRRGLHLVPLVRYTHKQHTSDPLTRSTGIRGKVRAGVPRAAWQRTFGDVACCSCCRVRLVASHSSAYSGARKGTEPWGRWVGGKRGRG